jgi:hypothetical protein
MQWEAEFEALRRRPNEASHPLAELTDEQILVLADEQYAGLLKWDENSRGQGLSDEDYEERDAEVVLVDSFASAALAKGDAKRGRYITHLTLKRHGINLPKDSPGYHKLIYALLKATVRANDAVRMRQQGKVVDTPRAPAAIVATPPANRNGNGVSLADLLDGWAAERKPTPRAREEWASSFEVSPHCMESYPSGRLRSIMWWHTRTGYSLTTQLLRPSTSTLAHSLACFNSLPTMTSAP